MIPESFIFKRLSLPAAIPLPSHQDHFCRVFAGWAYRSLTPYRKERMGQPLTKRPSAGTSKVVVGREGLWKGSKKLLFLCLP